MAKFKKLFQFFVAFGIILGSPLGYASYTSVTAAEDENHKTLVEESLPGDFVIDENNCLTQYNGYAETVTIPANVVDISYGVFMEHTEIKAVVFSEGVKFVDEYAFYGCSGLHEIILPESIEKVGRLAFGSCRNIEVFYIGKNLKTWGEFALWDCDSLSYISVNEDNNGYSVCDGILYTKDFKKLIFCPCGREGIVGLHENTVTIDSYAFFKCDKISEINSFDNLVYVDEAAFCSCKSLLKVSFGKNVKKIRSACFQDCESLKEFTVSESVKSLGSLVFIDCPNLVKVTFLNSQTEIGKRIFFHNKNVKICGYLNSTAEKYAQKHGYNFEKIKL